MEEPLNAAVGFFEQSWRLLKVKEMLPMTQGSLLISEWFVGLSGLLRGTRGLGGGHDAPI